MLFLKPISSCEIEKVKLYTNHACNYVIDEDCYFGSIKADINAESAFSCMGYVQNQVSIKTEEFKKIDLSKEDMKKLIVDKKFVQLHNCVYICNHIVASNQIWK
jgi:hypothetical protein